MDPQTFSKVFRHLAKSFTEVAEILDSKNNIQEETTLPITPSKITATVGKQRKEKDPNAPKRPPSGYALFTKEKFESVSKENPELSTIEKLKLIGRLWEKADHSAYDKRAQELRQDYKEKMEEYTAGKSPSSPAIATAVQTLDETKSEKPTTESPEEVSAEPSKKKKKTQPPKTEVKELVNAPVSSPIKNEKLISDSQSTIISTNSAIDSANTEGKKKKKKNKGSTNSSSNQ